MHLSTVFLALISGLAVFGRETVEDAARIAREVVDLSEDAVSVMATVYDSGHPTLANDPFAIQEYYASCHQNGSLTLLVIPLSINSKNIRRSAGHRASISVSSPKPSAAKPRVSLVGSVTVFNHTDVPNEEEIRACYVEKHPDSKWWLPGDDDGFESYWARFDPESVYFIGGYGGIHYIGYIPLDLYQAAYPGFNGLTIQDGE